MKNNRSDSGRIIISELTGLFLIVMLFSVSCSSVQHSKQAAMFQVPTAPNMTVEEKDVVNRVLSHLNRNNLDKAKALLAEARTNNSSTAFDFIWGMLLIREGEYGDAAQAFRKATAQNPDWLQGWQGISHAYLMKQQFEEASQTLTKVVELGGANATIYGMLGHSHAKLGNHAKARKAYRKATEAEPEKLDWQLGLLHTLLCQSKYQDAADFTEKVLKKARRNNGSEQYREQLAKLKRMQVRIERLAKHQNEAVPKTSPRTIEYYYSALGNDPQSTAAPEVLFSMLPQLREPEFSEKDEHISVMFIVNENGDVIKQKIQNSTRPELNEKVLTAIKKWEFLPAIKDGKPIRCRIRLPLLLPSRDRLDTLSEEHFSHPQLAVSQPNR